MTKITLSGHILVPRPDLQSVRDALDEHIALTRAENGCIVFEVTEHPEQVGRFEVYEEFADREAFAAHQERARHSKWSDVSANASRHYSIDGLDESN